ncbi:polysaccharide transporter [Liquorilactobacillus ghanensis DSM 18630]|uniref:Polysaccharide transporter n=1 Tax=Liquorilactobacillus ghanensis DSM 18630 TaxID=1423750 RepID=A0A0R1VQW8_9LACO|nr:polysaccharide biosynthesis protein [Liquorilactobacillus ghanensis]KRM08160.1 polysaccharide transporter [Liquorilactobacillus ghanensis DSM 18630]
MGQKRSESLLLRGTVWLAVTSLIVKILSAVYRIPFQNMVGNIGFYIYQQVYPFYGIGMTFALTGFPTFISKKVAQESDEFQKKVVARNYWYLLLAFGCCLFGGMQLFATRIASGMGDPRLTVVIQNVSWMYLLLPFLAVGRGYCQGNLDMATTAHSQLVEQLIRVGVILAAAYIGIKQHLSLYLIGSWAILGGTFGALAASIFFWPVFWRNLRSVKMTVSFSELKKLAQSLFSEGLIFCLNAALLILLQLIDSFTLKKYLQTTGLLPAAAASLKGVFDRGQPLLQLGLVITNAIAVSSLPTLVKQQQRQNEKVLKLRINQLFQLALLFALAAAVGLAVLMPQINWVLFGSTQGSWALTVNSLTIPLVTIITLDNVLLQIEEQQSAALKIILLIMVAKLIFNRLLIAPLGINGAAWASVLSLLLGTIVAGKLEKKTGFSYLKDHNWLWKMSGTLILMGAGTYLTADLVQQTVSFSRHGSLLILLVAIPIGGAIFFLLAFCLHILDWKLLKQH